jgi:hypothetical protein
MSRGRTDVAPSAVIVRTAARCVAAASAVQLGVSLYVLLVGGFRVQLGPLRVSAGSWFVPFFQAVGGAVVAAGLFYGDAALRGEWDGLPRAFHRAWQAPTAVIARRFLWSALAIGTVASIVVCYRMSTQALVVGSPEGGWVFGYVQPASTDPFVVAALVATATVALLAWSAHGDRPEWQPVVLWVVVATGLQAALRSLTPFGFEQMFTSDTANSFYSVTQQYQVVSVLGQFNALREVWPLHAQSNMPGKLLFIYALEMVSGRPSVLAWLVVICSNLGGVFLYVFVRRFFANRTFALFSLILYLFVPGKLFFFPLLNTVTPTLAFAWLVAVERWLAGQPLFAVAAGVGLYAMLIFDPLPLVLGVLFAAMAAIAVRRGSLSWPTLGAHAALAAAAFAATHAVVTFATGFDLVDALHRVATDATAFNQHAARPYGIWVTQNVFDLGLGAGVCQTLVFGAAIAHGWWFLGRPGWEGARSILAFCFAIAAMVAAIDLAGINRGEVVRLWIFLECLLQVPAAYACAQLNSPRALGLVVLTSLVQSAVGTSMIGFVIP